MVLLYRRENAKNGAGDETSPQKAAPAVLKIPDDEDTCTIPANFGTKLSFADNPLKEKCTCQVLAEQKVKGENKPAMCMYLPTKSLRQDVKVKITWHKPFVSVCQNVGNPTDLYRNIAGTLSLKPCSYSLVRMSFTMWTNSARVTRGVIVRTDAVGLFEFIVLARVKNTSTVDMRSMSAVMTALFAGDSNFALKLDFPKIVLLIPKAPLAYKYITPRHLSPRVVFRLVSSITSHIAEENLDPRMMRCAQHGSGIIIPTAI